LFECSLSDAEKSPPPPPENVRAAASRIFHGAPACYPDFTAAAENGRRRG